MELSQKKSEEQAAIISIIAPFIGMLDAEYLKKFATQVAGTASFQDSIALLNPAHSLRKNDLLRAQAETVMCLLNYIEKSKEIDRLKDEIASNEAAMAQIRNLFV